jgi:hypothetical protein
MHIQNYTVSFLRRPQYEYTSPSEPKEIYCVIWIHFNCCRMSVLFCCSLSLTYPYIYISRYSSKKLYVHCLHYSMINCGDLSNKTCKNRKQAGSYINTGRMTLVFMFSDSGEIVRRGDPVPQQHPEGRHGSLPVYREQRNPAPRQQALRSAGSV